MNLILGGNPGSGLAPGGAGGAGGAGAGAGRAPPGTIQVSQEEMDAINRLTQLGFPKHKAAEAYFACDKNEEFAANFLFETAGQDEEEQFAAATAASVQPGSAEAQPAQPAQQPAEPPAEQPADQQQQPAAEGQQQQQQQQQQPPPSDSSAQNPPGPNNDDKKDDDEGDGGSSLA